MGKVSTALKMLNILSTGKKYTIDKLAELLEVSPRMVRNYKDDLEQADIYIDTIMGKNGGYIYKGVHNFNQQITLSDLKILEDVRYKLHGIHVDNSLKQNLDILIDKVRFLTVILNNESNDNESNSDFVNFLIKAIHTQKEVHLKRKNRSSKSFTFQPKSYNVYNDKFYITGVVKEIDQIRTFNINEIILK